MSLAQIQHWLPLLTDNSPFLFAILDSDHKYVTVNNRYSEISGLNRESLCGRTDPEILGEHFYSSLKSYYDRAFNGEKIEAEITLNDHRFETSLHFSLFPIEQDGNTYIVFHAVDTSERQLLLNSLEESESKYRKLTELLTDAVFLLEGDIIVSANTASATILGFNKPSEFIGESIEQLFSSPSKTKSLSELITALPSEQQLVVRSSANCATRAELSLSVEKTHVLGSTAHLVILKNKKPTEKNVAICSPQVDLLTGIYNRHGFTHVIEKMIKEDIPFFMLYLDIDNFKNINDSLGHHIGDRVLKEISTRLQKLLPKHAVVGHLGGDEFGIIFPKPEHNQILDQLAEKIINLINQPFDLVHFSKRLACSIGSVQYPVDGTDARSLLQNADTAMYEAKDRGRNRLIKFHDQMNKEARMRLWLEIELQKALQNNGLEVWYQPKVSARDFRINGAEALVRWKHPVEGYISPARFIPVAERSGLIETLGKVVMREVFQTVKEWGNQGILPGRIAINLSPAQFGNPQLIEYMERLLKTTQVDPNCITLELTESAVMSDGEHAIQMLDAIKKLGFTLSIDDFGTGYSSLAYLARFPVDELKIDRGFISEIDTLPKQITIIENVINLGKNLNMDIVAEGVETRQQAMLLSSLNCDSIQGFHFYKPQPKQEIEALLVQNKRASS
ncbi:sensor domain-containing protein [Aliivibrio logei]|uniref:cyclic-guanylate-specific phosphodiesterase n=2 Tax=Aliivibrio logei TaxID=688 RepID=A0A1B9NX86_ALILO|nr:EAL domain-containing protein [Aliivibrio logei]OCH20339.1 c-di-GMP phosphodiesterase [Aliivibrio logei]OEF15867.1 c-di-GMP phosphodiesterase [Aliivibrio logei 5S-186]